MIYLNRLLLYKMTVLARMGHGLKVSFCAPLIFDMKIYKFYIKKSQISI